MSAAIDVLSQKCNELSLEGDEKDAEIKNLKDKVSRMLLDNDEYVKDIVALRKENEELKKGGGSSVATPQRLATSPEKTPKRTNGWILYRKQVSKTVRENILMSGRKPDPHEVVKKVGTMWKEAGKEIQEDWKQAAAGVAQDEEIKVAELMTCLNHCPLITNKDIIKPLAVHILQHTSNDGDVKTPQKDLGSITPPKSLTKSSPKKSVKK